MLATLLTLAALAPQDPAAADVLAKYGLKPSFSVTATDGKATIAPGETIELVGATDLADPFGGVWSASGALVDGRTEELFWRIIDLPTEPLNLRKEYAEDPDKRTFAMAFKLSGNLTDALDVRADVGKTFAPRLAVTRSKSGSGQDAYLGVARIVKPILPKESTATTFDFRLEVPGGAWVKVAEFAFGPDTALRDGEIKLVQRYQDLSDFKEIDGERKIVDYKAYYFTMVLPDALRELDLEVVTNDDPADLALLPKAVTQHIRGEDQAKEFAGKDLFLVYGLRSGSPTRKFSLMARPKRTVVFKAVPFKRT